MDEKTGDETTTTEVPTLALSPEDCSAGNVDPVPELLADGETVEESSELNKCEPNEIEASLISTDTSDDFVVNNLTTDNISHVEKPVTDESGNELSSGSTEQTKTNDDLESTSTNLKLSTKEEMTHTEPMEIDKPEEKSEQVQEDPNNAVYELEEELKRLHGDTSEETKPDSQVGDLSIAAILEDKVESTQKKDNLENVTQKPVLVAKKIEDEKPIMRDSDLEEMLSAEDVTRDPALIKGIYNKNINIFIIFENGF